MRPEFEDKCALVVGAGGGLGAEVADELARRGARVAIAYRTDNERVVRLRAAGAAAHHVEVTDEGSCARMVTDVVAGLGDVDVLVHAAGPHVPMTHLSTVPPERVSSQLAHDTGGFLNVVLAALPYLRRVRGTVVAITTAATDRFPVRDGLSSIPKAAVEAAVRALAVEEGRYGVRLNCVGPGMLTDGMAERLIRSGELDARALDVARRSIPLGRFGNARDVAEAVCFLAGSGAGFITGQKINVDGGYTV